MRKHIIFIQSVSGLEWEVGEIICHEIKHNPDYSDCCPIVLYAKTFQDLKNILISIHENVRDASIIIQIVAHSNTHGIGFRDVNNLNKEGCYDYVEWSEFYDILECLYKRFGMNITMILISCYSSSFAESIELPHVPIIAAEGKIVSRRAEEQLIKFYEKVCTGFTIKEAYDFMIESFPVEDEMRRDDDDRSILKLYM